MSILERPIDFTIENLHDMSTILDFYIKYTAFIILLYDTISWDHYMYIFSRKKNKSMSAKVYNAMTQKCTSFIDDFFKFSKLYLVK